jgi:hypothetical protein
VFRADAAGPALSESVKAVVNRGTAEGKSPPSAGEAGVGTWVLGSISEVNTQPQLPTPNSPAGIILP